MAGPVIIAGGGLGDALILTRWCSVRRRQLNGLVNIVVADEAEAKSVARSGLLGFFQASLACSRLWCDETVLRTPIPKARPTRRTTLVPSSRRWPTRRRRASCARGSACETVTVFALVVGRGAGVVIANHICFMASAIDGRRSRQGRQVHTAVPMPPHSGALDPSTAPGLHGWICRRGRALVRGFEDARGRRRRCVFRRRSLSCRVAVTALAPRR